MIQQFHSWVFIQRKQYHWLKNIYAPLCLLNRFKRLNLEDRLPEELGMGRTL